MESCNHEQSDLLVHTQNISLAWALAYVDVELDVELDVKLWLSSLDLP